MVVLVVEDHGAAPSDAAVLTFYMVDDINLDFRIYCILLGLLISCVSEIKFTSMPLVHPVVWILIFFRVYTVIF